MQHDTQHGRNLATLRRGWPTQACPSPRSINSVILGLSPGAITSPFSEPQRPHLGNEYRQLCPMDSSWRPGTVHSGMPPRQVRQVPGQSQLSLPLPPRRAQGNQGQEDQAQPSSKADQPWHALLALSLCPDLRGLLRARPAWPQLVGGPGRQELRSTGAM